MYALLTCLAISFGLIQGQFQQCSNNQGCPTGSYCYSALGSCRNGSCRQMSGCSETSQSPVCGCDGKNYTNACQAQLAGASVLSQGACSSNPNTVSSSSSPFNNFPQTNSFSQGITCQSDATCLQGQFCAFTFGQCGGSGQCITIPSSTTCDTSVQSPICGCDGKTYLNQCVAYQSKVSGKTQGECPTVGVPNDCTSNTDCKSGSFCNVPDNKCDAGVGKCFTIPTYCTTVTQPVCGCDGIAYQNECMAKASGISLATNDTCFIPKACETDNACEKGFFCQRAYGKCTGSGYCLPRPPKEVGCLDIANIVCGCNGVTYKNQCFADQAGVSTMSNGTCPGSTSVVSSDANVTHSSSTSLRVSSFYAILGLLGFLLI